MKQINLLIGQFPNSNSSHCFTEEELKRLFYFAMPMRWCTNFINSGQSLHSSSIKTLKTYMVHQEHQTDAHQKRNKETNKSKINNKNKRYNHAIILHSINNQVEIKIILSSTRKKRNGYQMMMTAPSMGQFTSGANVTKTNMVTISGPAALPIAI